MTGAPATPGATTCRACGGGRMHEVLDLGDQPPANRFLRSDELGRPEPTFPLEARVCLDCALLQIPDQLPPGFFSHYLYVPSASAGGPRHFDALAAVLVDLAHGGLVVDVGCNDGLLLGACVARGARVLGIDPADNLSTVARSRGVPVTSARFGRASARALCERQGPAEVIVTTNTINHVDDLADFAAGLAAWLSPSGTIVIEVPHVGDLLSRNAFDTVYHEHLSAFSLRALGAMLEPVGLAVVGVEALPVHGGSMRVLARRRTGRAGTLAAAVTAWLAREEADGLFGPATYDDFRARVLRNRDRLRTLLGERRGAGRRIAGYGAPAKGTSMLSFCGIGPALVDFVVDRNPLKHGLHTPGTHLPILPVEAIDERRPDDLLVLAWNFLDEIVVQQDGHRRRGGRFIVPIPQPHVLEGAA